MFFSIDHARFIYRQLLAAPRLGDAVTSACAADRRQAALSAARPTDASGRCARRRDPVAHGRPSARRRRSRRARGPMTRSTALALADRARAASRDRSLPSAARARRGRSELGGVALLQRAVARPAPLGVHVASSSAARSAPADRWGGQVLVTLHEQGRPGASLHARRRDVGGALLDHRRGSARSGRRRVTVLPDGRYAVRARAAREEGARTPVDARSRGHAVARRVLPGRDARRAGHRERIRRAGAARRRERLDLRRRAVRAIRRRPGISRSQLGSVARRDVGVGRRARGCVHASCTAACSPPDSVAAAQPLVRLPRGLDRIVFL